MEDPIVYHTQPPPKTFVQLRNEAKDPFMQLYYEILSRFHLNDYEQAIGAMTDELRAIVEGITAKKNGIAQPICRNCIHYFPATRNGWGICRAAKFYESPMQSGCGLRVRQDFCCKLFTPKQ